MKRETIILSVIGAFVLFANPFAGVAQERTTTPATLQERTTIPSTLKDATVFFRGAELNHTASARLMKGENKIVIEGLSPSIDINSLRIKANNKVVVSSYEFSVDYLTGSKAVNPKVKQLEESIKAKTAELDKIAINIKINNDMRDFLKTGTTKNVSGSEKGMGIEELRKTMDYYKAKSAEIEAELATLTKSHQETTAAIQALRQQLNQEKTKGSKTSGVLRLSLSAPREGDARFEISYYTQLAAWSPYYEINIESTDKPLTITTKSKVSQTTGLDWNSVRLTLSTATPSNGKTAPLFNAWFLYPYQSSPVIRQNAKMMQNSISYAYAEEEMLDEVVSSKQYIAEPAAAGMGEYVNVSENVLNMVYAIDLPYTIPGNGKIQNIDLQTQTVEAEYKYYCAPKLDTDTYVVAEVADWQELGLMSAPAVVIYDGTNIGETQLDAASTQDKLSLTLGTDKRVSVKRERIQDYSSSNSLGSNTEKKFTYRITVKNNQRVPIRMVTKDQYPLSSQKNIEVSLDDKHTTKWTANIKELGVITWEEDFAPGETKVYEMSYSVKYPKDMNINL